PSARVIPQNFNAFVRFVPITCDADSKDQAEHICEINNLEKGAITRIKWVKPVERRQPGQRVAHAIISFTNENAAN
ncbi:hypothetical protein BDN72DRAFT_746208, partial [Pluteus cervinus]